MGLYCGPKVDKRKKATFVSAKKERQATEVSNPIETVK